jgi:uncharacterized protein
MLGRFGIVFALFLISAQAAPAADGNTLYPDAATIPQTREIHFTSTINREPFSIQVWLPQGKPPKAGYSVLYVLDGELYFPFAQFFSNALPGLSPVVVGIGHDALSDKAVIARFARPRPNDLSKIGVDNANDAFAYLRIMDFTTPVSPENRGPKWLTGGGTYSGGEVDKFLRVIEAEIKPKVEALVPINKNDQAIFGHSLGGLAAVRALFTEPKAFHTFIASSPALFWNNKEVLNGEPGFESEVRSGAIAPRVLITAAAEEPEVTISSDYVKTLPPDKAAEIAPYIKMLGKWGGMKAGAKALGDRLNSTSGKGEYKVRYELIPGVDHGNEPRISMWDALNFAFPR